MLGEGGGNLPIEIEIRKFKNINLSNGTVLEAFPSVGLVSTISSSYLISTLELDQICALESEDFPPISMVYSTKPKFPARIYAREDLNLAIFISEFPPPTKLHRPIAKTLLSWTMDQGCRRIISLEGLPKSGPKGTDQEPELVGVGSNKAAREELDKGGIPQLEVGMISGVSGVLLNEGRWDNFNVISLLAEAIPDFPDAYAAAKLVEGVNRLVPEIEIESKPLVKQAAEMERYLETLKEQAKPAMSEPVVRMFQ
ncbi:MAG: proteasome assembly chaperone family protein [Methanobacteriota archaeon]|nr:MAG: proteasome assembly chaperone family protein [Euryarchaeota archaeon]